MTEVVSKKVYKKPGKFDTLAVGLTVHYRPTGNTDAVAFVTRVHDKDAGLVNLFVVRDDFVKSYNFADNIKYSDEDRTGTWHFIEKE